MKKVKQQVQNVLGFDKEDVEALLHQAAEVQTTDDIPLEELKKQTKVDSKTETLNDLKGNNPSTILDRNAP